MEANFDNIKAQFSYSIENKYEGEAFTEFQKKYVIKKTIFRTVLYFIIMILFAIPLFDNPKDSFSIAMIGLIFAIICIMWFNIYLVKKRLLDSLKELENDKYQCTVYDDRFTIKTIECKSLQMAMDNAEDIEIEEDEVLPPKKVEDLPASVIKFGEVPIFAVEKSEIFVIMYGKKTIYVFPKKNMTEENILNVRDIFKEKLSDNFVIKE